MEIWKKVPGYEAFYEVSSLGRVRSFPRIMRKMEGLEMKEFVYQGRVLKPARDRKGYLSVRLYGSGRRMDVKVHRLVAMAFIPNPSNLPQINHKDEDKGNNSVQNLEWCDAYYNRHYGTRMQATSKPVAQCSKDGAIIRLFQSAAEAGRITGIFQSNITANVIGKRRSAGGFVWHYL